MKSCQKDIVQEKVVTQESSKAGFRTGDDAPMAVIELVDRNPEAKVDKPKKTETKDKKKNLNQRQKQQLNKLSIHA